MVEKTELPCKHQFCKECIEMWLSMVEACPYCRNPCAICAACGNIVKTSVVILLCGHKFCHECITDKIQDRPECPECGDPVEVYEHEESVYYLDLDMRLMQGLVIDVNDGTWSDAWLNPPPFVLDD